MLGAEQLAFEPDKFQRQHDNLHVARTAYRQLFTGTAAGSHGLRQPSYPYRIDPVYDNKPFFFGPVLVRIAEHADTGLARRAAHDGRGLEPIARAGGTLRALHSAGADRMPLQAGMGIALWLFERQAQKFAEQAGPDRLFRLFGNGFHVCRDGCMQWLNLYLGHPMYCADGGPRRSAVVRRLRQSAGRTMARPVLAKLRLGMLRNSGPDSLWLLVMKFALPPTEHWVLGGRIAVVLLCTAAARVSRWAFPAPAAWTMWPIVSRDYSLGLGHRRGKTSVAPSILAIVSP